MELKVFNIRLVLIFLFTISSAHGQDRFGTDELFMSVDKEGQVQTGGLNKKALKSYPLDMYLQWSDLMFEFYYWAVENQAPIKDVTYDDSGLQINGTLQPDLILPHVTLGIFASFIQGCSQKESTDECDPLSYDQAKDGLLERGMSLEEFNLLVHMLDGDWDRIEFASAHPLTQEEMDLYRELRNNHITAIDEISSYIEFERDVKYRAIPNAWVQEVLGALSLKGQRVLLAFLDDTILGEGSLHIYVSTGPVSAQSIEGYQRRFR